MNLLSTSLTPQLLTPTTLASTALLLSMSSTALANEKGTIGLSINLDNTSQVYKNIDGEADASISLQYRGEKLNLDEKAISYKLMDSNKLQFEVLAKNANRGYEAKDSKNLKGMADRDASLDLGGRVSAKTPYGLISLEATGDVSGTHDGYEADLRIGPDHYLKPWNGERELTVNALAGLKWKSDKTVDYYYGVKNSEATASRSAYKGNSALAPYLGVNAQMNISKHFTVNGSAIYNDRPKEITNSPIVDKKNNYEFKAGVTYWF